MIIQENESNVTMFGQMETVEFEIKTDDAKMFHILSNLYSDPLGAVVREISTNCCDGHKIKGNVETPFDIILPGYMDMGNFITFRDYGPGMSHQNIKDIYTKFGQSTKVNSNDQTGCLGLGSKSPLAITSSFTVTSINEGIKTVYSISKDNHGKPNLSMFGQSPSEEENGLMVTVPLTGQYVDKVVDTIKNELKYFKVKPRIMKGAAEMDEFRWHDKFDNFFELIPDQFYITKREATTKSTIIQGEIGYAFSGEILLKMISVDDDLEDNIINEKMKVNSKTLTLLKRFYTDFGIKLFSDMGTVSFAPNREELIYDTATSKNLIRSTITAIQYINEIYIDSFSYIRNPFDYQSVGAGHHFLKTDNEVYKKFISKFGFKFSSAFDITKFILQDGSSPSKDGIKAIRNYQCFSNIEQFTTMTKKTFEEGFLVKKHIKSEKNYRDYRTGNYVREICSSNQDYFHFVFINDSKDFKFVKKHLANYYNYFNEKNMNIAIIELRHLSPGRIDEFIKETGLTKNSHIPYSDVVAISEYQSAQEKALNPEVVKEKAPSREVILKKGILESLNGKVEDALKFRTTTTEIREELTGIYITTFNNDIVYSDRVKNQYPEIFNLYSTNSPAKISQLMILLNEIGGVQQSKMNTQVFLGNEKNFNKTKLVHFEDFILQHINSIKLLTSLNQKPKQFNLLAIIDRDNTKIMEMFEIYDNTFIGPVQTEIYNFRKELHSTLAPLQEWFYNKDSNFLKAYNIWKNYKSNNKLSVYFRNFSLLSYSRQDILYKLQELFNFTTEIYDIDNILTYEFKNQYLEKFENIRRYSSTLQSYMTIKAEIRMLIETLEDINTKDYIAINVKNIVNIPVLPIHTCEEPPPPTEEELAMIAKEKELARIRKENELRDLYLEEKFNFEYIEDGNNSNEVNKLVAE